MADPGFPWGHAIFNAGAFWQTCASSVSFADTLLHSLQLLPKHVLVPRIPRALWSAVVNFVLLFRLGANRGGGKGGGVSCCSGGGAAGKGGGGGGGGAVAKSSKLGIVG